MDDLQKKLNVLFELDKYEEVLSLCYENLYAKEADKYFLYEYIIISHINLKDDKQALKVCDEALGFYPSSGAFLYYKSLSYYNLSLYKQALVDVKQALDTDANSARYLALYAKILLQQDKYIQAKEAIEKALEIDSSKSEYHLTLAIILYMLDGKKVASGIIDEVLEKEPHNEMALGIKQKYFTDKLKERKSILESLLFLNPFDKSNQRDIKFIKNYYKFTPIFMLLTLISSYLLQSNRLEFGYLESISFMMFVVSGVLGSHDWRINMPFIAVVVGFDAFNNLGSKGIGLDEVFYILFQAVIFHFVFKTAILLFDAFRYSLLTKFQQQKNSGKNPLVYFLFINPFEKYEELDADAMKRYYVLVPSLIVFSLILDYVYMFYFQNDYFKIALIFLFLFTATLSAKNFWITILYIFMAVIISKELNCDGCIATFIASALVSFVFVMLHNFVRSFGWMRS